ncbi:MAG: FeoB-associated Cys-rich membrane protein [Gammaproteobacteria bacterium]|nr:FeoB-associated Cys-rich membrane protein [Gammaproteobacteria bacterium]MCW8983167.1 FeoB-associated Cys-rich membrane protein [Gammaproteobacteria bacterium]
MTHILALIGLVALLTGWVLFQEWLKKNGKEYRPGCGGGCSSCSTTGSDSSSCSTESESEPQSTPQFVKIDPPKSRID